MKERPILFSTDMVRAILDGRKTVTRRVIKPQPKTEIKSGMMGHWSIAPDVKDFICPYGGFGDVLWVRETCWVLGKWLKDGLTKSGKQKWKFCADNRRCATFDASHPNTATKTTPRESLAFWKRPSIHVPKWASRITLKVTDVRSERLQDINEEDAAKEGIEKDRPVNGMWKNYMMKGAVYNSAINSFISLWDSINAKRGYGWDANPWVFRVGFEVMKGDSDGQ